MLIRREVSIHGAISRNDSGVHHDKGCYLLDSYTDIDGEYCLIIELPCGTMRSLNHAFYDVVFLDNKENKES